MMVLVAIASFIASIPFIVLGFWPVAGFYGLDVILLYFALRTSFKAAKSVEHLNISPFDILLRKVDPSGEVREWHFFLTKLGSKLDQQIIPKIVL